MSIAGTTVYEPVWEIEIFVQHPQNSGDKILGVFPTCVSGCGQPDVPGVEIVSRVNSDLFHSILRGRSFALGMASHRKE